MNSQAKRLKSDFQVRHKLNRNRGMVTDTGHFQADRVENNIVGSAAYLTAWIDKQYKAEGEPATPSFINREAGIFYWGPAEPTEQ